MLQISFSPRNHSLKWYAWSSECQLIDFLLNYQKVALEAKSIRSWLIKRCRLVAPQIFRLPVPYFQTSRDETTKSELLALFMFNSRDKFNKLPPILFPASVRKKGKRNNALLFMGEELPLVRHHLFL